MVMSGTETNGNINIPSSLLTDSQEEAYTLLVLHAELVVSSSDKDVLLLLVYMYPRLPISTTFLTGKGSLKRKISVLGVYRVF